MDLDHRLKLAEAAAHALRKWDEMGLVDTDDHLNVIVLLLAIRMHEEAEHIDENLEEFARCVRATVAALDEAHLMIN